MARKKIGPPITKRPVANTAVARSPPSGALTRSRPLRWRVNPRAFGIINDKTGTLRIVGEEATSSSSLDGPNASSS